MQKDSFVEKKEAHSEVIRGGRSKAACGKRFSARIEGFPKTIENFTECYLS